jgi:hypothetical protein
MPPPPVVHIEEIGSIAVNYRTSDGVHQIFGRVWQLNPQPVVRLGCPVRTSGRRLVMWTERERPAGARRNVGEARSHRPQTSTGGRPRQTTPRHREIPCEVALCRPAALTVTKANR